MRALWIAVALAGSMGIAEAQPAPGELRGHGGPVRALALTADGSRLLSGSFDQSAIVWALDRGIALGVLRATEGAVNAVAVLPDGRFATGGEDGTVALWDPASLAAPVTTTKIHAAPIVSLAATPGGALVSASWDGTAAVTDPRSGAIRRLEGHQGNVNGAGVLPDGRIVTAGYDATLRLWPADGAPTIIRFDVPLNALAVSPAGTIAAGGADSSVFLRAPGGEALRTLTVSDAPILALAFSRDGRRLAVGTLRGGVTLFEVPSGRQIWSYPGRGIPVWALAFSADGAQLVTGNGDRTIRRLASEDGTLAGPPGNEPPADVLAELGEGRGAEVFRACAVCHTLTPDGGNRAGPTLHGVIGRRIGTVPGYVYSPGFPAHDIVWSKETIARLFELGPQTYTPGTKMPEQTVATAEDRAALVDFIDKRSRQP